MQKKQSGSLRVLWILLFGLISGCWFNTHNQPCNARNLAELIRSGPHGRASQKSANATWISDPEALQHVFTAIDRHQLGSDGNVAPDIDWRHYGVLFIEMGHKPTGGYSIDVTPSLSRVVDKQALIHISWNTPAEGVLLTQAVTSSYMLLKICRADITSIVVVDQDEQPLFEIPIE